MIQFKHFAVNCIGIISIVLLFLVSCKPDPVTPSNSDDKEQNISLPNSNAIMIKNVNVGESTDKISLIELTQKDENSYYFYASTNDSYSVGEIDYSGNIIWIKELDFEARGILKIDKPFSPLNNNLLVVGVSEYNGKIAHYNKTGTLISDIIIDNYPIVEFNDVVASDFDMSELFRSFTNASIDISGFATDLAVFYTLGAAGTAENINPFAQYFSISNNGIIEISNNLPNNVSIEELSTLFNNIPSTSFNKIANNTPREEVGCVPSVCTKQLIYTSEDCSDATIRFNSSDCSNSFKKAVSCYTNIEASESKHYSVCRINENFKLTYTLKDCKLTNINITYQPITIGWNVKINDNASIKKGPVFKGRGDIIVSSCGNIYVAGTKKISKFNHISINGMWDAAFVAKLDPNGTVKWSRTYAGSNFSDRFESVYSDGSFLYASGLFGHYTNTKNDNTFGYGAISKISLDAGNLISIKYFGDKFNQSGINSINGTEGRIIGVGAKSKEKINNTEPHKGWFVEFNIEGL